MYTPMIEKKFFSEHALMMCVCAQLLYGLQLEFSAGIQTGSQARMSHGSTVDTAVQGCSSRTTNISRMYCIHTSAQAATWSSRLCLLLVNP